MKIDYFVCAMSSEPAQLLQTFATYSDEELAGFIESAQSQSQQLEADLRAGRQRLEALQAQLALAHEAFVTRRGLQDLTFIERWKRLLDTTSREAGRFEQLNQALLEVMDGRHPLVMQAWTVRQDNRQAVLGLHVPQGEQALDKLYQFLLKLLPALVNGEATDPQFQGAVLDVRSRSISDKEWLTLVAQPNAGRYELQRRWRDTVNTEYSCTTLFEMLKFLAREHPYWA